MSSLTTDRLPELNSEYPITADLVAAYQRDGHVYLPQVLTPDSLVTLAKAG